MRPHLPRLHVLTDTTIQAQYSHLALAQMAWEAGDVAVQYRHKSFSYSKDLAELQSIAQLAQLQHKCLLINDNVALAFEVKAQGVHLGQGDGSPRLAAECLGTNAIVGATVHSLAELDALAGMPIDYIGVGPVFGTRSKATGLPDLGLDGLAAICEASRWPVIAIGSIGVGDVAQIRAAGAYGVAVISAFCLAENPIHIARTFLDHLEA